MANTRVFNVDQDFARTWLRNWDLLVLDGSTDFLDDLSPLLVWNVWGHCGVIWKRLRIFRLYEWY